MRNKLALTIALAGFAIATAFGVGLAGAEPEAGIATGQATGAAPSVSAPRPAEPEAEAAVCGNQVDDDGDGAVDLEDPDCDSDEGASEEPAEGATGETGATGEEGSEAEEEEAPGGRDGVRSGKSLSAEEARPQRRGSRGGTAGSGSGGSGGDSGGGGVTAPRATAGDQPVEEGADGGSQYGDGGAPEAGGSTTIAPFGPAPLGVPNIVIDSFEIPPFLLPIYQACGTEYGIPWQVLASINKIETGFGTNLNVSSAGAMGWMQFIPSSWQAYGLDANGDGRKDPYNPVDAICAAAHYLDAAGGRENLYDAIFAYNHADWYVQEVLLYARAYGKLPADLVGSLTGLTEGAHFPIAADARYADDISTREALREATPEEREEYGDAASVIASSPTRRGINIFAEEDAPVVAVNDGIVVRTGRTERLGRFVVLRDAYGNRFTYASLGRLIRDRRIVVMPTGKERRIPVDSEDIRPRLRALPGRTDGGESAPAPAREVDDAGALGADGEIRVGSKVIGGTVLARVGAAEDGVDSHIHFAIQPAGKGAPRIDPKPILDGWKLLEATAIYRARGKNPFARRLGGAGVLLLSKEALIRRILADRKVELSECDRIEIRNGQLDRRLLAALSYLSERGFRLTITSMLCGRQGSITTSGHVSLHSYGNAADIAAINGIPVLGNQGPGSVTEELLRAVLRLQGTMVPSELISLQEFGGPSFAMADHADHVHLGYSTLPGEGPRFVQLLKPGQWLRLTDRLGEIENPAVPTSPSEFSLPARKP